MEFLLVIFEDNRVVHVGGLPFGKTNLVLELEAGTHTVTLAPPYNFSPVEQKVRLEHTAALDPCRIVFTRLPASAIPYSPGRPA